MYNNVYRWHGDFYGKFPVGGKHVAEQGRKAVFALIKNTKPFMFIILCYPYLTHIVVVYYVIVMKYGTSIKHQILKKNSCQLL